MTDKQPNTFHGRLVLLFIYSLALAIATNVAIYFLIQLIYRSDGLPYQISNLIVSLYYSGVRWPLIMASMLFFMFVYYSLLAASMASYVKTISRSVEKLAGGDFTVDIPVKNPPELGVLAAGLNLMKEKIDNLVEEEKRAVQTKNELITNVSHDLRTPLTSIMGYLRLIEEDNYKDEVELRYYVDIAYEKSKRLNRMVNDLFEFTKVNNREVVLHPISFNIIELLKQLSAQFSPQLKHLQMELNIHHEDKAVLIDADPDKMMRVFENLLSNALKYGKDGKKIDVIVEKEGSFASVKVVNYGERIPSNALPHIFDRLYRVETSRSDETGGAGLGLAIARGIVELHHGTIEVTSNEAETAFHVKIPLTNSEQTGDKQ